MNVSTYSISLFLLIFVLSACTQAPPPATAVPEQPLPATETAVPPSPAPPTITITATSEPQVTNQANWWDDAVFYEIFVRSFQDSDGDGVGDFNGLISRLDYLQQLGITGLWLMPIAQSPSYHGYDVVDYYQVDDEYGTKEDFLRFMEEAHARDIRVIVDLVLNHTSREHAWFQEALEPTSEKRDWYVWGEEKQQYWHETVHGYYYGYFWEGMPDLNYRNPAVSEAMQDVTRFWLEEMGVDGFRLDAIKHLVEEGEQIENTEATHEWLQEYHDFYKSVQPDALAVGEVWSYSKLASTYVPDEVDLVFEFDLADAMLESALMGNRRRAQETLSESIKLFPRGQFATFLANHDQTRTRSRLIKDEQAKLAATMQLMTPGVPFIYYGEEIGMEGKKPDENLRRPMQWTGEKGVGFTTSTPWNAPFEDYQERHVAAQQEDANSLLAHYRALIQLRNQHQALRTGEWLPLESEEEAIYAFLRYDDNQTFLILMNLGKKELTDYALQLTNGPLTGISQANILLGEGDFTPPTINTNNKGFSDYQPFDRLPAYSSWIIQLEQ